MGAEAPQSQWFVQAGGKVWGPYPDARIEAFVCEGRVAAGTLLGTRPEGPFDPASSHRRLTRLFGEAEPEAPAAEPARPAPAPAPAIPAEIAPGSRALLVWAALKSQRPDRFEELLGAHGPFVRAGPGLWLVRARVGPAGLRNAMTRRLAVGDVLMVVEAPLDQAAWFNLDGEADRALRRLWSEKAPGAPPEGRG
jgi:hypothetical protein